MCTAPVTILLSNPYRSSHNRHAPFPPELAPQAVKRTQVSQPTTNSNLRKLYIFCIFYYIQFHYIYSLNRYARKVTTSFAFWMLGICRSITAVFLWSLAIHYIAPPLPQTTSCFMLKSNTNTGHTHTSCKDLSMDEWQTQQWPCSQAQACSIRKALDTW